MELKDITQALEYLKNLDVIIMPTEFTYFNHCASFELPAIQANQPIKKSWTELPLQGFDIKREMSFVERNDRVRESLEYGGVHKASISYAMPLSAKPFIIRVIMPKRFLSEEDKNRLGIDLEYAKKLEREYMGLGDGRHPKLGSRERIYMFASSTKDEVSGKDVDILYGVREQDILRYANSVKRALERNPKYPEAIMPVAHQVPGEAFYEWDFDYKFDADIYAIPKAKDFSRYLNKYVIDSKGEKTLVEPSDFEQEYMRELIRTHTNTTSDDTYSSGYHK